MVDDQLSDGLPDGWTVQFNVLKTGRKIKYYLNTGSGQKFSSKDDVVRYVQAQKAQVYQPQLKNTSIEGHSKDHPTLVSMEYHVKTFDYPKWLPHGWIMELRSRNSGSRSGEIYKCYVDLSTGYRFYSKPQVLRYLETRKQKGWISKKRSCSILNHTKKVKVEKCPVEGLPPGWTKELKFRKSANGIKKDPYYTDPVTGYVFRSRKEVQRYLETGEISKHAFLPKRNHVAQRTSSSRPAKGQKQIQLEARQLHFSGKLNGVEKQSSDVACKALSEDEVLKKGKSKLVSPEPFLSVTPATEMLIDQSPKDTMSDNDSPLGEKSVISWTQLPKEEGSIRSQHKKFDGNQLVLNQKSYITQQNSFDTQVERRCKESVQNVRSKSIKKGLSLPHRSSKRLAGLEPELMPVMTKLQSSDAGKLAATDKVCYDGASTELVEIEGSIIPEGKAAISEPMLLGTSTFWIAPQRHQADNSAESNENCRISCAKLLKSEVSVDSGDGIILNTEVNTIQEQNFLEKEMTRSLEGDNQDDLNKNNKKALKFRLCSSKRFAGLEPELMSFGSKFQHYNAGEAIHADNGSFVLGNSALLTDELLRAQRSEISKSEPWFSIGTSPMKCPNDKVMGFDTQSRTNSMIDTTPAKMGGPSRRNQLKMVDGNNGFVSDSGDIVKDESSLETGMERGDKRNKQNKSSTFDIKKQFHLPCHFSAGLELFSTCTLSGVHSSQKETSSCRFESILSDDLINKASQQLNCNPRNDLSCQSTGDAEMALQGEASRMNQNSHHSEAFCKELEKDICNDEKSEFESIPPFEEFLSDPCLAFAFRTLTGAVPVESAVDTLVVSIPATDIRNENNLPLNNTERSNNEITVNDNGLEKIDNTKTQNNSRRSHKRKKFGLLHRSSKQNSGLEPESVAEKVTDCHSARNAARSSTRLAANSGIYVAPYFLADEASEQLEAGAETESDHHDYTNRKASELKVSSNKCKEPVCNYVITENQSIKLDMEKINENPESEPFSLSDYWSDYPCLEFAVKTLTGAWPVEDPLALHGYFQQVNISQTQKEAYKQQQANTIQFHRDANLALPDIGFQNDTSVHFDVPERQHAFQPLWPLKNPLPPPSGNVGLPNCSTSSTQQPHLEGNKGLHQKVKSQDIASNQ